MAPSNTFFEQIPVKTVKRIAEEFREEEPTGGDAEDKELPDEVKSGSMESWRAVAEKIQHEQDPRKMSQLIDELIARLNQERSCKHPPIKRHAGNRSD